MVAIYFIGSAWTINFISIQVIDILKKNKTTKMMSLSGSYEPLFSRWCGSHLNGFI